MAQKHYAAHALQTGQQVEMVTGTVIEPNLRRRKKLDLNMQRQHVARKPSLRDPFK